ncbi:MAG: hypothetical protein AB1428_02030 [Bacteroidota bacterium]
MMTSPLIRTILHILTLGLILLLSLPGCGGYRFLTDPPPQAVQGIGNQEDEIRLHEEHYRYDRTGAATLRTHRIIRVGSAGTFSTLSVEDGSMVQLTGYEARVVHADGSLESYDLSDLASSTLSNRIVISQRLSRSVRLERVPGSGDLVEFVSEHRLALPQLGVSFSPADAGDGVLHASCLMEVPPGDTVIARLVNDTLGTVPSVLRSEHSTLYRFDWHNVQR